MYGGTNSAWDQPRPLMSVPIPSPVPIFRDPIGMFPGVGILPTPPYRGITSTTFTSQVPSQTLPYLRFPPTFPPVSNQPVWNPYIFSAFRASFADLFDAMLNDNFNPGSKGAPLHTAIRNFRKLPLEEQLQQFMYSRTLSAEEVRIRWQLVLDILFILRHHYPLCEVHAFGSVLSGLGDLSSDIDIYVSLQGSSENSYPALDALHRTKNIFSKKGLKCPHTGSPFSQGPLISVTKARVPILKLTHAQTLTNFDLSFENRLSAQNSKLMILYTNLDPRVFRLMVIIRYWLKVQHLSGPSDIKNYALNLLVLVYLMDEGIIPSVHLLQNLREQQRKEQGLFLNSDEIDGWDASFCEEPRIILQHFRATPLPLDFNENPTRHLIELAIGFFKMCAHTDFGKVVVCPLLGEIILKGGFVPGNEQFLTDMLGRYKKFSEENDPSVRLKINSLFCIQDPFVLNFNVISSASPASVIKFQLACAKTVEVMTEKLEEEQESQSEPTVSLLDLFLFTPLPKHLKNKDIAQCCRAEVNRKRLTREILEAFGMPLTHFEKLEKTQQKSKYVKLPRHFLCIDKIMEIESYQKWQQEQSTNETVYTTSIPQKYCSIFMAEVKRCGLLEIDANADDNEITKLLSSIRKMTILWRRFVEEFLDEFFPGALKLEIMGDIKAMSASAHSVEIRSFDGSDFQPSWRINVPPEVNEHNDQKEEVKKKIEKIADTRDGDENYYKLMTVQVSYPFWKRPYILEEWEKSGENKRRMKHGTEYTGNPVYVEALISAWFQENYAAGGEQKKKKKRQSGMDQGDKKNSGERNDDDIQVVEEVPRGKRARLDEETFSPFNIDVLVKISTKLGNVPNRKPEDILRFLERPYMSIVFRSDKTGLNVKNAVNNMSSVFVCMFEEYQLYRLKKWLDCCI